MSQMRRSMLIASRMCAINVLAANTSLIDAEVMEGDSYSTQIVCDEGYSIYEITIKMGGVDITSTAYDPTYNMISIASVTDDVDIECYAMHTMPSDYIRVDGIKNPSNAYLKTGEKITNNRSFELDATIVGSGTIAATRETGNVNDYGTGFHVYNTYVRAYRNKSLYEVASYTSGNRYYLKVDWFAKNLITNSYTRDWERDASAIEYSNMCIWGSGAAGGIANANSAGTICHKASIYDYATTSYVRYYIPCLNASGVAGFWDAARGIFQGSSNSTAFEAWIEGGTFNKYAADGLWAMYDGIDNAGIGTHDSSATTWKDLAEHENDATIVSTVTWESNGWTNSSDKTQLVLAPHTTIQALRDSDFTIDYTIKPTVVDYRALSGNYNGGSAAFLYVFIASNRVYFRTGSSTTLNTNQLDLANTNHTITVRRKGVEFSIFVDGQLVAKANKVKDVFTANDSKYWIGAYFASQYTFRGKFYANRLYSKALSDEQIKFNHRIDVNRFGFYQTT